MVPEQIERKGRLGKGSFGETYLAVFKGKEVALKCVRMVGDSGAQLFLRELEALTKVQNPNVMAFFGAVLQPPQDCWLVVEYLAGGTLKDWIHGTGSSTPKRTVPEKLKMCLGIAKGMQVLSTLEPPILHRDLKPANVMLSSEGVPKVADFGLSRRHLLSEESNYTSEVGSYVYMSPEMMKGEPYGPPTDVYSFGILMAEIVKQKDPFEELRLTPVQVATAVADSGTRPRLPRHQHCPKGLQELMEACWAANPSSRPKFPSVVTQLFTILGNM